MERFVPVSRLIPFLAVALAVISLPVYGQINTACTSSVLATFTPCMNFLTNSTGANSTSPTADCCGALKNLTSNGMNCFCLIVTGSVPFSIPINRTLAISLPRACNMPGVPVQCKATVSPIPAPGPVTLGPTLSPGASPSASPEAPVVPEPTPSTLPPVSDTTPLLTPPSSTGDTGAPTSTTGSRPVLTPPSASAPPHSLSPSLLLFAVGFVLFKYY
ncbi:non-specific lipid transfer protein GPI-anchored 20 [Populus alba]|uniref:Leucine-rich repeat extensin-like protein 5 n=1 Tax=Populus alba TaxID=43335 RepID=A0A4U5Q126_POPAL|nr:non-specific lipid-transfer protein-like protein At2g13820 [Populus alba]TKS03690.1 leucine-rich repeat extensin-like protein 5 [Populus alba]